MKDAVFQSHEIDPEPKKALRINISENKQADSDESKFALDNDCPDLLDFMSDHENDEDSSESDSDDDCLELAEDSGSDSESDSDFEVFLPLKSNYSATATTRNNAVPQAAIAIQLMQNVSNANASDKT